MVMRKWVFQKYMYFVLIPSHFTSLSAVVVVIEKNRHSLDLSKVIFFLTWQSALFARLSSKKLVQGTPTQKVK